ncbi:MAG: hypothetical protein ABI444_08570 [Candidatus Kapaibacterium sp.]
MILQIYPLKVIRASDTASLLAAIRKSAEAIAGLQHKSFTVLIIGSRPFCAPCNSEVRFGWNNVSCYLRTHANIVIIADSEDVSSYEGISLPCVTLPKVMSSRLDGLLGQVFSLDDSGHLLTSHKIGSATGFDRDYHLLDSAINATEVAIDLSSFQAVDSFRVPEVRLQKPAEFGGLLLTFIGTSNAFQIYNPQTKHLVQCSLAGKLLSMDSLPEFEDPSKLEYEKVVWRDARDFVHAYFIGFGHPVDTVVYGQSVTMMTETYSYISKKYKSDLSSETRRPFGRYLGSALEHNQVGDLSWVLSESPNVTGGIKLSVLQNDSLVSERDLPIKSHHILEGNFTASDTLCLVSDSGAMIEVGVKGSMRRIKMSTRFDIGNRINTSLGTDVVLFQNRTANNEDCFMLFARSGLRRSKQITCSASTKNFISQDDKLLYSVGSDPTDRSRIRILVYNLADIERS